MESIKELLNFQSTKINDKDSAPELQKHSARDIAIIGVGLNFPKALNAEEFWRNIAHEVDCIREIPAERKTDIAAYLTFKKNHDASFVSMAFLEEIDKFDHDFFGVTSAEAALMDPHQRLFLETVWRALEDAGYGGERLKGSRTGVYLGFSNTDMQYMKMILEIDPFSGAAALPGNLPPVIAGRMGYLLDFKGPGVTMDTTCSSALVAVHYACQGLRTGEAQLAVAGTVSLSILPVVMTQKIGIESADGKTRTFDATSDGTGNGEGVAAVLLKPLPKALEDGDHIYAVIKGSAVNQDGASIGLTAPNPAAQEEVLCLAWKNAGIPPETISYIEAHGTGTRLGDPIEIDGINRAFGRFTDRKSFCAVGSVKTNIGHLNGAAGMAGLLKAALALQHKQLPPSLHFHRPHRQIPFEESPVYVTDRLASWEANGTPRRCGVSSFGFSGTNCHLVLEEAPPIPAGEVMERPFIFTVSALSEEALRQLLTGYEKFLHGKRRRI